MNSTTNLTGALSRASNSMPVLDLPNAATTSSSRSEEQCGMAMPNPMPVLIVSSRCLSAARIGSRSAALILPRLTSRSISSTMAGQRSVAFISGMICSAESKLARDMRSSDDGMASLAGAPRLTSAICHTSHLSHALHFLAYFVIKSPGEQPTDAEHVDRSAKSAVAQTVFALAKAPRSMIDRYFNEPVPSRLYQRRNEPVHSLERNQCAHAFAPHRFEGATGVAHTVLGESAAHRVGDPAGQPLQERVLALCAITADEIGTARNLGEKPGDVRRVILQIAIDENRGHAAGRLKTGINCRALSGIFLKPNQSNVRRSCDSADRAIHRSVVHKNNFVIEAAERFPQLGLQDRHVIFL